ncbi:MAG: hypothetical protein RLZ98_2358 [Pseudomonadota bacterium]
MSVRTGARIKAGIEVLGAVINRHRPASLALADWGRANRYAGSGDRSAIGNLVYDVLRHRSSLAVRMGSDAPRALVLAAAPAALGLSVDEVVAAADGSKYSIPPLSDEETAGLLREVPADAPAWVRADIPDWLWPSFERVFAGDAERQGVALAERAPVDLRVNTLRTSREQVLEALAKFGPVPAALAPNGVRLPPPQSGARQANVEAEGAHGRGWFEVQDEGSQVAAAMTGARAGMKLLDYCAGAGGKTLALAAMMGNKGCIMAYDRDRVQLRPIFDRLPRSGATNVEVADAGDTAALAALEAACDVVLVDAPCTGSGTWRRRPDSKWRLQQKNIPQRQEEQRAVLDAACRYVKSGGRLVYVTCSVLAEENTDTVAWFVAAHPEFALIPFADVWRDTIATPPPKSADGREDTLLLTPASHGTDGFFVAVMGRLG